MADKELFRRGKGFGFGRDRSAGEPEFFVTEEESGELKFWIDLDGYDNNAVWDLPRDDVRALRDALTAWLGDGSHAAEFTGTISSEGIEVTGSRLDSIERAMVTRLQTELPNVQVTVVPYYDKPAECRHDDRAKITATRAEDEHLKPFYFHCACGHLLSGDEIERMDFTNEDLLRMWGRGVSSSFGPSDDGQSFLRRKK